jgi:hypothetical protein
VMLTSYSIDKASRRHSGRLLAEIQVVSGPWTPAKNMLVSR